MLLVCCVILFVLVNVILTLFSANHQTVNTATSASGVGYNSSNKWVQGDTAKYISIEVLSSKNRVRICVDDATVIYTLFTQQYFSGIKYMILDTLNRLISINYLK